MQNSSIVSTISMVCSIRATLASGRKGGESRSALRDSDEAIPDQRSLRETASLVVSGLIAGNGPPDGSAQFECHGTKPAGKPNGRHRAATAGRVALGLVFR